MCLCANVLTAWILPSNALRVDVSEAGHQTIVYYTRGFNLNSLSGVLQGIVHRSHCAFWLSILVSGQVKRIVAHFCQFRPDKMYGAECATPSAVSHMHIAWLPPRDPWLCSQKPAASNSSCCRFWTPFMNLGAPSETPLTYTAIAKVSLGNGKCA